MMKPFFRIAAIFDWITGFSLVFMLDAQVKMLGLESPNYPGIFTLVGGITFLFGWVFWQVAKQPENRPLFQVALLAKIIPFLFLTGAVVFKLLPNLFFLIVLITDGLWIPPFVYFYKRSRFS